MRKKLRRAALIMLIIAVLFVVFAVYSMDSTITLPFRTETLRRFYKIYVIAMLGLFVASFAARK